MNLGKRRLREEPELNVVSLVDVVLLLLIFFMLTMHCQEVEGKMLSQLPKDKGLPSRESKPMEEGRLTVRAGRRAAHHVGDLQVLVDDEVVAVDQSPRQLMVMVAPLVGREPVWAPVIKDQ